MTLTIQASGLEDPYAAQVSSFFALEFPGANHGNSEAVLEGVTSAFVSSNQIRFGPAPNPESLVAIRQVIRDSIAAGLPIPVLTPFGSRKSSVDERLDIAEVASLKQLACLQQRVGRYYAPGIRVNIRLEDASGHYLFADEGEASRRATAEYCDAFQRLVRVLGMSTFIRPVLESTLFDERAYAATCDRMVPVLMAYLTDTDANGFDRYEERDTWKALVALGWQGRIPVEQRDYYRNRYATLYPGISPYEATMKLVRYFAGSWARLVHKGSGADAAWGNDYIRVTFVAPIPGAPVGMVSRNIYYRTLPTKFASTHCPAWRAKGFLKINGDVTPKIASWQEQHDYQRCQLVFGNETESVAVQADYVLS